MLLRLQLWEGPLSARHHAHVFRHDESGRDVAGAGIQWVTPLRLCDPSAVSGELSLSSRAALAIDWQQRAKAFACGSSDIPRTLPRMPKSAQKRPPSRAVCGAEPHSPETCPCVQRLVTESEALYFPTEKVSVFLGTPQVADLSRQADVSGIDRDDLLRLAIHEFLEREKSSARFV